MSNERDQAISYAMANLNTSREERGLEPVDRKAFEAIYDEMHPSTGSDAPHSETVKTAPNRVEQLESIVRELAKVDVTHIITECEECYSIGDLIRRSRELQRPI